MSTSNDAPFAGGGPIRTCVGCRRRANKLHLLRVVADRAGSPLPSELVPDPDVRLPGRGAYVHPDPGCLDLAERRRAFPRALRVPGPLDMSAVRRWIDEHHGRPANADRSTGQEEGDST